MRQLRQCNSVSGACRHRCLSRDSSSGLARSSEGPMRHANGELARRRRSHITASEKRARRARGMMHDLGVSTAALAMSATIGGLRGIPFWALSQ